MTLYFIDNFNEQTLIFHVFHIYFNILYKKAYWSVQNDFTNTQRIQSLLIVTFTSLVNPFGVERLQLLIGYLRFFL